MTTETISVPEVHCGHCVASIEGALAPLDGVTEATVDLGTRTVSVTFDDAAVTRAQIVATIEDQGYDVPDDGTPGDEDPSHLPTV